MQKAFDLIVERLEEEKTNAYNNYHIYQMNMHLGIGFGAERAIEIVNQVAEQFGNPEQVNDGWIPCSERNPEEKGVDKEYLCTFARGEVTVCRWQKWADNVYRWVRVDDSYYEANPVAWRELPQPYLKGE